jgi:hypothetical protein
MTRSDPAEAPPPISEILDRIRRSGSGDRIAVADISEEVRGRVHGVVLIVFGLPETIPMIGLSVVLAAPIFVMAVFMMVYGNDPPLPEWVRRRSLPRSSVESAVDRSRRFLRKLERFTRPRWPVLAGAGRLQGGACMILAGVLAFPMPGINIVAAFGVVAIGFGILQSDGRMVAFGLIATAVSSVGAIAVVTGAFRFFESL